MSAGPSGPPNETSKTASYAMVHILFLAPTAYPVRVSVFTLWPEDVQWQRLSPRLLGLELLSLAVRTVLLVGVCLLVWWFWPVWPLLVAAGGFAVGAIVRAGLLPRSIRSWGYAEREDDLLVRHGLMVRRLSIVPYGRMQFVDVTAGALERAFGISTVQLHTAAAASDARIPGLLPGEAARLRDQLTALGHARAEGL